MKDLEINSLDWQKMNGLLPAIIQNAENGKVLLLGYMNQESLIATLTTGQLTLYSRSRKRVWRKGESSGNSMLLQHISTDCDNDSLLIQVIPKGAACHLGNESCYLPVFNSSLGYLDALIEQINKRSEDTEHSFTAKLLKEGIEDCAQKMGEKAVATTIAAANHDKEELINQSADLIYYLLVLFKVCELSFYDVLQNLKGIDKASHT